MVGVRSTVYGFSCLYVGEMLQFVGSIAVGDGKKLVGEVRREYPFSGSCQFAVHYGGFGVASCHKVAAYGVEIIVYDEMSPSGIEAAIGVA